MINHAEAQSLISARLDEPLDPIVSRELDAHLATCPTCRAFANQTTAMTRALQDLPRIPASPQVRRTVLDSIQKPASPWTRFQGFFAPGPGSALSTVAAVLVVGLLSVYVLTRLLGGDDGDDQKTLLAPSVETTQQAPSNTDVAQANPTATSTEAELAAPTTPPTEEPTVPPTEPANNQAPTEPAPTEPAPTTPPTEAPQATDPPADVPTATESTAEKTGGNAIRIGGTDASATATPESAATETPVPTDKPTEPAVATETPVPTDEPTETVAPEPTETIAPTDEPTEPDAATETAIPTETPVPVTETPVPSPTDSSPKIEPKDGTYASTEEDQPAAGSTETVAPDSTEPSQVDVAPTIAPKDPAASEPSGKEITPEADQSGNQQIADGTGGATETAPLIESTPVSDAGNDGSNRAASNDPGTTLGTTDPSQRIMSTGPESWAPLANETAPQVSSDGVSVQATSETDLELCLADGSCQSLNLGDSGSSGQPVVTGWIDNTLVIEQQDAGGQSSYYAVQVAQDGQTGDLIPLGPGGSSIGEAFVFGESLLVPTEGGWFTTDGDTGVGVTTEPAIGSRDMLRLYPDRGYVAYLSDGAIWVENVYNGYITGKLEVSDNIIDFDLSETDQIVVSTGSAIEIWDLYGSHIATYSPPSGNSIGSVAWAGDSIVYVDTVTGEVREIAPSDFGPVESGN